VDRREGLPRLPGSCLPITLFSPSSPPRFSSPSRLPLTLISSPFSSSRSPSLPPSCVLQTDQLIGICGRARQIWRWGVHGCRCRCPRVCKEGGRCTAAVADVLEVEKRERKVHGCCRRCAAHAQKRGRELHLLLLKRGGPDMQRLSSPSRSRWWNGGCCCHRCAQARNRGRWCWLTWVSYPLVISHFSLIFFLPLPRLPSCVQ
jgi:hypothetical protein